ncbi:MAG: gluconate 2-dehydrogenase subunit 3 family protein [Bryobacteraceae bacterium]
MAPAAALHAQQHAGHATATTAEASKQHFSFPAQEGLVAKLAEMIIPADEHSPGAHEAKVSAFIDGVVADTHTEEQRLWTSGLAMWRSTTASAVAWEGIRSFRTENFYLAYREA